MKNVSYQKDYGHYDYGVSELKDNVMIEKYDESLF